VTDPFGPHNLPYGVLDDECVVRVGDRALRLKALEADGLLDAGGAFQAKTLDPFMAMGRTLWSETRARIRQHIGDGKYLRALDSAPQLPFTVGDYVDFFSSEEHATNLGRLLRPGSEPLLPNWKHLPVGYHGRSGTVVVSGTAIKRPSGQLGAGVFGPSRKLDIEAELGFVVGVPSAGPVPTGAFRDHVFGAVLVNDWSARDIQAWEYQPLGPFLGKSFATSVSAWVVPLEALADTRTAAPHQDPEVLPYLREADRFAYDIRLEVSWNGTTVSRPPFRGVYWTPAQQLAHLTVNGATVRTGDLYASGTISGPMPEETGSFIERTWNGAQPVCLDDGSPRTFLEDGDTVTIAGFALRQDRVSVGFGEVVGSVAGAQ